MSTQSKTEVVAPGAGLTGKNKAGLVLAVLLGLNGALVSPFVLAGTDNGSVSSGPPMPVLIVGAVLGVITLLAVGYTWRTGNRIGARIVAGVRVVSVLLAVPAFFVSNVAPRAVAVAAVVMVVTVVTIVLVLSRPSAR